jgi:hypothetical protein
MIIYPCFFRERGEAEQGRENREGQEGPERKRAQIFFGL